MKLAYILFAALCFVGNMSAADGNAVSKQDLQDIYNVYAKAVTEKIKPGDLLQGEMAPFSLDSSASESRISVTQGVLLCMGVGFGGRNGGSDELLSAHGRIPLLSKYKLKLPEIRDEDFDKDGVLQKDFVDPRDAFDKKLIEELNLTDSFGRTPKMLCVNTYSVNEIHGKKLPETKFNTREKDTNEHKSSRSSEK